MNNLTPLIVALIQLTSGTRYIVWLARGHRSHVVNDSLWLVENQPSLERKWRNVNCSRYTLPFSNIDVPQIIREPLASHSGSCNHFFDPIAVGCRSSILDAIGARRRKCQWISWPINRLVEKPIRQGQPSRIECSDELMKELTGHERLDYCGIRYYILIKKCCQ